MEDHRPSRWGLVVLAVVFEGGLGLVALALGWWLGVPALATFRWGTPDAVWGTAAGLAMLALLLATVRLPVWPFSEVLRIVDELLVPLFRDCGVWDLAVIATLAGLGEEMLFRGVIQEAVARWTAGPFGPWIALGVAAVLFGLVHPISPGYVVLAGLMGLYLGWIWMVRDNLLVPIVAHAVYDFAALVYLAKVRQRDAPPAHEQTPAGDDGEHLQNGLEDQPPPD